MTDREKLDAILAEVTKVIGYEDWEVQPRSTLRKAHLKIKKLAAPTPAVGRICFCSKRATWVRMTQFAGNHYFCTAHAKKESDFRGGKGSDNDSYFWKRCKEMK